MTSNKLPPGYIILIHKNKFLKERLTSTKTYWNNFSRTGGTIASHWFQIFILIAKTMNLIIIIIVILIKTILGWFHNKIVSYTPNSAQKMKFSIKDFFSKCAQIRRKLRIWSHLLKISKWKTSFFLQCSIIDVWEDPKYVSGWYTSYHLPHISEFCFLKLF